VHALNHGTLSSPNVSFSVTSGEPNVTLSETLALWLTGADGVSAEYGLLRRTKVSAFAHVTRVGLSGSPRFQENPAPIDATVSGLELPGFGFDRVFEHYGLVTMERPAPFRSVVDYAGESENS